MTTPRVSIVVATHNRRAGLAHALASIDAQHFRDFEVVVVVDGSTDGTATWLRTERPTVRLVELCTTRGAAAARNQGVACSSGEIVAFLDDDDAWRPAYLDTQVANFDAHPDVDVCSTGHVEVDPAGRVTPPDLRPVFRYASSLVHLLAECPLHTLSVVACRRAAWARVGPFDETLTIVHDLDWYARFTVSGGRREHTPVELVERGVPGGLVARHRDWYEEERAVHRRLYSTSPVAPADQRRIRASRALLFARVGVTKGDHRFGFARVVEAIRAAPIDSGRIAMRRLARRRRRDAAEAWSAQSWETK